MYSFFAIFVGILWKCLLIQGGGLTPASRYLSFPGRQTAPLQRMPSYVQREKELNWGPWSTCYNGVMTRESRVNLGGIVYSCVQSRKCQAYTPRPNPAFWGPWEPWSACQDQQGTPFRIKTRVCKQPPGPSTGNFPSALTLTPQSVQSTEMVFCLGTSYQTEQCAIPSPTDSWNSWSECSVNNQNHIQRLRCPPLQQSGVWESWSVWSECISSRRFRYRECPSKNCNGLNWESTACENQPVIVVPLWGGWSQWSYCQQGSQTRRRQCTRGSCVGDSEDRRSCTIIQVQKSQAVWLEWTTWSSCDNSNRFRTRTCSTQGGCRGSAYQTTRCTVIQVHKPQAVWFEWTNWSSCDNSNRFRTRTCSRDGECGGLSYQTMRCTAIQVQPQAVWLEWTTWSFCDNSNRFRTRTCSRQGECGGSAYQTTQCRSQTASRQGYWSSWSACNNGVRQRDRICPLRDYPCQGNPYQYMRCTLVTVQTIPVVVRGSEWSAWSQCNDGLKTRQRQCGGPCGSGSVQKQLKPCYMQFSLRQGNLSSGMGSSSGQRAEWGEWGPWDSRCGDGNKRWRHRSCRNMNAGSSCVGTSVDSQMC